MKSPNICADGYLRPSLATDVVLFTLRNGELHLLLIKRGQNPHKGSWALPGGFVQEYEPIAECASRELEEETGVELSLLEQFGIFDRKGRDPRGWYVSVAFFAITPSADLRLKAGTDAAKAKWFPVAKLPSELAFDHDEIIQAALDELRKRADRFDQSILKPVFAMLPDTFTLSQMQEAFDTLQGLRDGYGDDTSDKRTSDKRNFRKKVLASDFVEEVPGQQLRGSHRPAQLYRPRADMRPDHRKNVAEAHSQAGTR